MWSACKTLRGIVFDVFCNGREVRILELEAAFERHKNLLLSPLQTEGRNTIHREAVKKAVSDPISLPDIQQRVVLSQDFVDEVLILSDLFETDELIIVELLLTAESQLPSCPHLSRGLLAVSLFYDARLSNVDALRTLIQARDGRNWSPSLSPEASQVAEKLASDLWKTGLLSNILHSLQTFSVLSEYSHLEAAQALGPPKHRSDIFILLNSIENGLAECLLLWSCQTAFNLDEFKLVLDYLMRPNSKQPPREEEPKPRSPISDQLSGTLSRAHAHVLMSLLYALDSSPIFEGPIDQIDEISTMDVTHPLFSDRLFASGITQCLDIQKDRLDKQRADDWSDQLDTLGLLRLAWSITLRRTSHLRTELARRGHDTLTRSPTASPTNLPEDTGRASFSNDFGVEEDDETQVSLALDSGALEFLRKRLLAVSGFERELLWVYRLHSLITDLLVYMPARVKEIRLRDEDLLRRTGFDPSSNGSGFANFLLLIAELYDHPGSKLHARLALEYWWPAGELGAPAGETSSSARDLLLSGGLISRSQSKLHVVAARRTESEGARQASLFRFVRSVGDFVTTSSLFIPYVRMLHGIVGSRSSASFCFSLLRANATNPGRAASLTSWDHYFSSLRQYLSHMKQPSLQQTNAVQAGHPQTQIYPHLYGPPGSTVSSRRPTGLDSVMDQMSSVTSTSTYVGANVSHATTRAIKPEEQVALQTVLRLISRIARLDPVSRSLFAATPMWQVVPTCLGLLTCPVPLVLKADLIHLLTALSGNAPVATLIWRHVTAAEILPIAHGHAGSHGPVSCGLHTEIDEVEPRAEEYPITRAFLSLITVLASHISGPFPSATEPRDTSNFTSQDEGAREQGQTLATVISFLVNTVFLKHAMRAYRDPNERWDIAGSCLVLFDGLIDQFLRRLDVASTAVICNRDSLLERDQFSSDQKLAGNFPSLAPPTLEVPFDWASTLFPLLWGVSSGELRQSRFRSSAADVLAQLRLPPGWPYNDPGFDLTTQLLSDSSLFRTLTGLLQVGLHRILEFPIPDGPPSGMIRATAAGLRLIHRLLVNEEMLLTFVRRAAVGPSFGVAATTKAISLPTPPMLNTLPTCLSKLLVSINSRTGRADLIPMLLKYCTLFEDLPDHCSCAIGILSLLIERVKPHSSLVSLLTADRDVRRDLLNTFSSLLRWSTQNSNAGDTDTLGRLALPNGMDQSVVCFTDEWLFGGNEGQNQTQLASLGVSSSQSPHPCLRAARLYAALPYQPPSWFFCSRDWELLAAWPTQRPSLLAPIVTGHLSQSLDSSSLLRKQNTLGAANWLYEQFVGDQADCFTVRMLHIILAAMDQPAPNLSHWLLGFRIESAQAVANTILQDAGIGDQPRTCLHAILDLLDAGLRLGPTIACLPPTLAISLQWALAVSWQIIYRLVISPLTSEALLRFLRGNHDLLAKHLKFGIYRPLFKATSTAPLPPQHSDRRLVTFTHEKALEMLSLNHSSWFLRTLAIELRTAAMGNQRSYVGRLLSLFFGDFLSDPVDTGADRYPENSAIVSAFLGRLNVAEHLAGPESFDLRTVDARLIDELLIECEMACPLLASDSVAIRKVSTLLDAGLCLNHLYLKLVASRTTLGPLSTEDFANLFAVAYEGSSSHPTTQRPPMGTPSLIELAQDLRKLCQWIEARNAYRLHLYAGKQAAFEAWREVVEIGTGVLTRHISLSESAASFTSQDALSGLTELGALTASPASRPRPRPFHMICLDMVSRLSEELCETETTPSTIRLLASGTLLHLSSYLTSVEMMMQWNEETFHPDYTQAGSLLISVVGLWTRMILQCKSSAQRMRANFYGTLAHLLRFGQFLAQRMPENQPDSNRRHALQGCLSAIASASKLSVSHWAESEVLRGSDTSAGVSTFHCLLAWDLLRGHTVTQMAVLSVLELILTIDRSSRDLLMFLCRQSILQQLVDSIPEDLKAVESFLNSVAMAEDDELRVNGELASAATVATSAFHMYRAKMALFSRLATSLTGAKSLLQCDAVSMLTACAIYSASTLANSYADGLDSLYASASALSNVDVERGDSKVAQLLSRVMATSQCDGMDMHFDDCILHRLICARSDSSTAESTITWPGVLLPVVDLFKTILITLGPSHVYANQQVIGFLYAHSDAVLVEETVLGSALVHFLGRTDWMSEITGADGSLGTVWLMQWLHAQTNLVELFALVSRTEGVSTGMDEYSVIQSEVVRSRILRNSISLLPTLLAEPQPSAKPLTGVFNQHRHLVFDHMLCRTQQLNLIRHLVSVCVASLDRSSLDASLPAPSKNIQPLFTLLKTSDQGDSSSGQVQLTFILHLVSWALNQLARVEDLCVGLANLNIFNSLAKLDDAGSKSFQQSSEESPIHVGCPAVRLLLHERVRSNDLSMDQLRQLCTLLFTSVPRLVGCSTPFLGLDSHHPETELLRNCTAVGVSFLRLQLNSLVGICEQGIYISWRFLNHYLNRPDPAAAASLTPRIQSATKFHGSQTRQPQTRRVDRTPEYNRLAYKRELPGAHVPADERSEPEIIREMLPSLLRPELLESVRQLSKASYLKANQRLFIQAMHHRLEQMVPRTATVLTDS
ncbi:hypothetical protein CRM22_000586 [Opisthorchis felineus]|uniref:Nuclear pore complex protein Nup205 n=1 Tax=Opisthorchis felineus TaxID=147828 RepID=A0A4S2MEP8_OPIFE|nr:hypothetical protein CRM22_000586 [Opisthorchis felineus]